MELLHNADEREKHLKAYLAVLLQGQTKKEIYESYQAVLSTATPHEVNRVLDALLCDCDDLASMQISVARFIRSVGKGLESYSLPEYPSSSLFASLQEENQRIATVMQELQMLSKTQPLPVSAIQKKVAGLTLLKEHYRRLQNELFPRFERASEQHACVKLMWLIQDNVLDFQKQVTAFEGTSAQSFFTVFGRFYTNVEILRYREHYILYPVAYRALQHAPAMDQSVSSSDFGGFVSKTGFLSHEELERIFSVLPFDIAFIGSDDRVKFYSDPPHRIFPRSPEVIGRLVQNCHPPKSVATVQAILDSFKEGREDSAEFFLVMKGTFVHIQYYAVRSTDGVYLGTMEVTQDATHLRSLTGEKRLLGKQDNR
ncbi:MAG: PAS domain-containing protein [Sphaerochaeta sp.]|uniref:PAS domain-containing protein n=1 Tax=Sphaerochaeta sp. TaxID=1972642 RepID=UPI003D09E0CB